MTGFSKARCRALALLVFATVFGGERFLRADELLQLSQNVPGDSKAIQFYADEITTWVQGNQRILLLRGTVLIEHDVVHIQSQEAVVWIDLNQYRRTGILRVDLYAEGNVLMEKGFDRQRGAKARVDISTRGELKLKSQKSRIAQQPKPEDPLYVRAVAQLTPGSPGPANPIQPASNVAPAGNGSAAPAPSGAPTTATSVPRGAAPDDSSPAPGYVPSTPPPAPVPVPAVPPSTVPPAMGTAPPAGPSTPTPTPGAAVAPPPTTTPGTVPSPAPAGPIAGPPPASAPGPPGAAPAAPARPPVPQAAPVVPRQISISPRTTSPFQPELKQLSNGEQALFITGGVIVTVHDLGGMNLVDIEADQVVAWSRGNVQQLFGSLRSSDSQAARGIEFYLTGNVEIRELTGTDNRILRATEVYYDVDRNVAVAHNADLEFKQPGLPDPVHFRADEMLQLSKFEFKGYKGEMFSSRLPSDPGLTVYLREGTLEEKDVPKTNIFGMVTKNPKTGEPETYRERLVTGESTFLELESVPIFYLPFLQGDANDPLGPIQEVNFSYNRIFGFEFQTVLNVYNLIGKDPIPGTNWHLMVDYLSQRGPALGMEYNYSGKDLLDLPGKYTGMIKAFGINDTGEDILGGNRGPDDGHPDWRGRLLVRHLQELPDDFTLQFQVSALSDQNFLEQYYKLEFDQDINQETYLYLRQQRNDWAWTFLVEPRIRNWVNETEWLPRTDGYLIGQSFFDLFTYNVHGSAGFGYLETTHIPPPPLEPTTAADPTGRFDLMQELSLPFTAGPFRIVPYTVLDLTYYTQDLEGEDRGRFYDAAGIRASIPFTRLYPDVDSELLNLKGLNHKIVVSTDFYVAHSDTPYSMLPQLDRLNDDATDQALRDIRPYQPLFLPGGTGTMLATSPLYDPQLYAIRSLIDNRVDTLDSIEVLEMDVRQRLQTKRGYPGMEHTVDWMTLDLSGSYFPREDRDNFGEPFAFLRYDYNWNVGDRTALTSTGWVDPGPGGAEVWTLGAYFNRPDRTNLFLGYRQIEPVHSEALTVAVSYVFSPKYAMTASSTYDFGTSEALSNAIIFTRMGSDLQVSAGLTYNALTNSVGFTLEIVPNIVPEAHRGAATLGSNTFGH